MLSFSLLAAAFVAVAAKPCARMENLVTFGDSYTDEGRLGYFIGHSGQGPPAGTLLPATNATATGGYEWGRMAANMTGAKYFDYAVAGATCSNEIISRYLAAINGPFPSVIDYEIPAFEADIKFQSLYPDRRADNTVYAMWIGTNDLGWQGFLSDSQAPGTTISTFVDCVWEVFDRVYKTGGRQFVLLNEAPLQHAPMYLPVIDGGAGNNQYWENKTDYNQTEYQYKIREYTTNVNTMFHTGMPFNLLIEDRWPGATFSVFDVHKLMLHIRANPQDYLTAPTNATGYYHHCDPINTSDCVNSAEPYSSFFWYDELHPTQRTEQIIAEEFVKVVNGRSKYGKRYRSSN